MKLIILSIFIIISSVTSAQTETYRFNFSAGASIQHYNGNLGSSLFQFKTVCFAGFTSSFGLYLNKSFDLNMTNSIGRFGYCATEDDIERTYSYGLRCPGTSCANIAGMGNLRSQIVSSVATIKFKFNNDWFLPEQNKISPYIYSGVGLNWLSDIMQRNCVNVGTHFSFNGGAGITYNFHARFNISYNLDIACFAFDNVYATIPLSELTQVDDHGQEHEHDNELERKLERRKDICMKNALTLGFNF